MVVVALTEPPMLAQQAGAPQAPAPFGNGMPPRPMVCTRGVDVEQRVDESVWVIVSDWMIMQHNKKNTIIIHTATTWGATQWQHGRCDESHGDDGRHDATRHDEPSNDESHGSYESSDDDVDECRRGRRATSTTPTTLPTSRIVIFVIDN